MWIDWRMGRNEIKSNPKWGAIKNVHLNIVTDFHSLSTWEEECPLLARE